MEPNQTDVAAANAPDRLAYDPDGKLVSLRIEEHMTM
jgi:hypothetical protein